MIRLSNDSGLFDNDLEKLAQTTQKYGTLYTITADINDAKSAGKKLKSSGYIPKIVHNKSNGIYKVYYTTKMEKTAGVDSMCAAATSDVYRAFTNLAGVYDYDFDLGTIWQVREVNGKKCIVKVVDDNDEDKVIRQKKKIVAASAFEKTSFVNRDNFANIFLMFYNADKQLLNDIEHDTNLKTAMIKTLNNKLSNKVNQMIKDGKFVNTPELQEDLARIITSSVTNTLDDIRKIVGQVCTKNMYIRG